MTKADRARAAAWRLKILRYAQEEPRQVARTCRHLGVSRTMFYRWKRRFEAHREASLADRSRIMPRHLADPVLFGINTGAGSRRSADCARDCQV